jgi:molybdopterin-guanine dinucleotide biosynthesis protein
MNETYLTEAEKVRLYQVTEAEQRELHTMWPDLYAAPVFHDTQELLDADPNATLETRFLCREDGINAIYPGSHVAIYGEPGAGKTMLAKYAAQQAIKKGQSVVHIDIDDNRAEIIAHDMLKFGASRESIITHWKLAQPDTLQGLEALWSELVANPRDLVIIDSMASLEGLTGADANASLDFVQRVYLPFVKKLMNAGTAVISIDHTGKDTTRKGAMGSTQKLAKSDLAIHVVLPESGEGLVPGELGTVALYVDKDRYGVTKANSQLREYSKGHMRSLWGTFCIPATGLQDARIMAPKHDAPNRIYDF